MRESEQLSFRAADGREIIGRWWSGARSTGRTIVFLPGLRTSQLDFFGFADHASTRGWNTLAFDYRGIGRSRHGSADRAVTLDDWTELDLPAAIEAVRGLGLTGAIGVIAHGLGGQLFGQSPIRKLVGAAALIGAAKPQLCLRRGLARIRLEASYRAWSPLAKIFADVPAGAPGAAVRELARWGRAGVFANERGELVDRRYAETTASVVSLSPTDNPVWAPIPAAASLAALYGPALVRHEMLRPEDWGLHSIGNLGVFRQSTPRSLWDHVLRGLGELLEFRPGSRLATARPATPVAPPYPADGGTSPDLDRSAPADPGPSRA